MVSKKANSTVKVTAAKAEEKAAVKEAVEAKAVKAERKAEEKAAKTPVAKPEEKADKKETEARDKGSSISGYTGSSDRRDCSKRDSEESRKESCGDSGKSCKSYCKGSR